MNGEILGEYTGIDQCHHSPNNWGNWVTKSFRRDFNAIYINRACNGAEITNITSPFLLKKDHVRATAAATTTNYQQQRCPVPEFPSQEGWNLTVHNSKNPKKDTCSHYVRPQIENVGHHVDLVFMSGGANDLNYSSIVEACYYIDFMSGPKHCREAIRNAVAALPQVQQDLVRVLQQLRYRLRKEARVVLVSYPMPTLDIPHQVKDKLTGETYFCTKDIRSLVLQYVEKQREAVEQVNQAAGENYVLFYNDTIRLFTGHEPDPSFTKENPHRWFVEFSGLDYRVSFPPLSLENAVAFDKT